jgi:hypothetical protein
MTKKRSPRRGSSRLTARKMANRGAECTSIHGVVSSTPYRVLAASTDVLRMRNNMGGGISGTSRS